MSRYILHHHPCQQCGVKTECSGHIEENYDGEPEWICPEFHLKDGSLNSDFICDACDHERECQAERDREEDSEP